MAKATRVEIKPAVPAEQGISLSLTMDEARYLISLTGPRPATGPNWDIYLALANAVLV